MTKPLTESERLILEELRESATHKNKLFIDDPTCSYYAGLKDSADQMLERVAKIIKAFGGAS